MVLRKLLNKRQIIIGFIIIMLALSFALTWYLFFDNNKAEMMKYNDGLMELKYDATWKIKSTNDKHIELLHNTNSTIEIALMELDNQYRETTIDELLEEVKYSIEKQNSDYKLIAEDKISVSLHNYDGYQLLYEGDSDQAIVTVGKHNGELFVINYAAENKYFDILLDSMQNIVWNFEILDKPVNVATNLKAIETSEVKYTNANSISCNYNDLSSYEIYGNHYKVKYSIPKCLAMTDFNSKYGYYSLTGNGNRRITLNTQVVYKNTYEYVTDEKSITSIANDIKALKDSEYNKNIKVTNEKIEGKYSGYIYKITYEDAKYDTSYEKIYLIYALDYLRTFIAKIEATNATIPEAFTKGFNNLEAIKYGEYITRTVVDGKLVDSMKDFTNSTTEKEYYDIMYNIPEEYAEQDYENNKYRTRYFKLGDNYEINLDLTSVYTKEKYVENVKINYKGIANSKFYYSKDITNNGVVFSCYLGNYSKVIGGNTYQYKEVYLISGLDLGGVYVVKIKATNSNITTDMINDFTFININKIKYGS